jgi:hypothetical protein
MRARTPPVSPCARSCKPPSARCLMPSADLCPNRPRRQARPRSGSSRLPAMPCSCTAVRARSSQAGLSPRSGHRGQVSQVAVTSFGVAAVVSEARLSEPHASGPLHRRVRTFTGPKLRTLRWPLTPVRAFEPVLTASLFARAGSRPRLWPRPGCRSSARPPALAAGPPPSAPSSPDRAAQ